MTFNRVALAAFLTDIAAVAGLYLLAAAARVVGDAIDGAEDDFALWSAELEGAL